MSERLGYAAHDSEGRNGRNSRNGKWAKNVLTGAVPFEISAYRDRDASFESVVVKKLQRRLDSNDQIVLALTAQGLTTGEISAHFAEIYGASVGKDQISRITDAVIAEMVEWQNRPLDRGRSLVMVANHGMELVVRQCVMTSLGVRWSRTRHGRLLSVGRLESVLSRHVVAGLVIEHLSYGITLQPGGHTEPHDASLIAAAIREVTEETGVDPASIQVPSLVPAYVEYGRVPARPHKGEPEHYHLDFGYAMTTEHGDIGALQVSEITGATWLGLAEAEARIGSRMARAVRKRA